MLCHDLKETSVAISRDKSFLIPISGDGGDGVVKVWHIETCLCVHTLNGNLSHNISLSSNARYLNTEHGSLEIAWRGIDTDNASVQPDSAIYVGNFWLMKQDIRLSGYHQNIRARYRWLFVRIQWYLDIGLAMFLFYGFHSFRFLK
jgi:hypothetical protein